MKSEPTNYIGTPVTYSESETSLELKRDIESEINMLDNLIELIVFTPRGSFLADPEFGFEYWNHEFKNIQYRAFNSGQGISQKGNYQEITKIECQESIRSSLLSYAPQLKKVNVSIELNAALSEGQRRRKVPSKHRVNILIEGDIDNGIGTNHYTKEVSFLIEPTVKRKIQY